MKEFNTKEYHQKIVARAIKDKNFCKNLKKNPKSVIERELGFTCPPHLSIEVMEQPTNKWYIVVPTVSNADSLSESELLTVAGGITLDPLTTETGFM